MANVIVDDVPYDFQNLEITLIATDFSLGIIGGVQSVEYKSTTKREKHWGSSRIPQQRTEGQHDFEGSLEMRQSWWHYIVTMAFTNNVPLAQMRLNIGVTYFTGQRVTVTDTLFNVAISGIEASHSSGEKMLMIKLPLDIMNIYYQGTDLEGRDL